MEDYTEPVLKEDPTEEERRDFQEEKASIKKLRHGPGV